MFAALSRALSRAGLIAIVAFATLTVNTAWAGTVDLGNNHNPGEIRKTCSANDGTYYNVGNAYGCQSNKADGGYVTCDVNNHCTGICGNCSDAVGKRGVKGVVGSTGTAGNASGTARAHAAPSHKVKPVAVNHPPLRKIATRSTRVH